jgi:hypothetical protein
MVYCDNYMSVVIASIAEVGHDGQQNLYITHRSGIRNQTAYGSPQDLLKAYGLIQSMLVQCNTGKTIDEHNAAGTVADVPEIPEEPEGEGPEGAAGLKVVEKPK